MSGNLILRTKDTDTQEPYKVTYINGDIAIKITGKSKVLEVPINTLFSSMATGINRRGSSVSFKSTWTKISYLDGEGNKASLSIKEMAPFASKVATICPK